MVVETATTPSAASVATPPAPQPDKRRITEQDADFRHLHAGVERQLWAGIRRYARALQTQPSSQHAKAASVFIAHQMKTLQDGYLAGHWEGERDYWRAFSAKQSAQAHSALSQRHGAEPNVQRMRRALMFYGAGSVSKMAREAQAAWAADQHATLTPPPAKSLAERLSSIRLDDAANAAMNAWLGGLTARVALSADIAWTGLQDGYLAAGTVDPANPYALVWWQMEPSAQHCFPTGTAISTPEGVKPIESIRVGDVVTTLSGPRKVTRLFRSVYRGELVRVQAGEREVSCTPNHPFLTQRGWIAAEALRRSDQVVLSEDGDDLLACHVRLPDANNRKATSGQVGILGTISSLLRQLTRCQWLKAWMAVPVVAVSLDNQRADANVNDEFVFDEGRWLEVNAKFGQDDTQTVLQFAGLVALKPLLPQHELGAVRSSFFGMRYPICSNLGARFCAAHWIVRDHVGLRGAVYEAISRLVSQSHMLIASARANGSNRQPQCRSNSGGPFVRVVFTHISETFRRPDVARRRSWRAWSAVTSQWQTTTATADSLSAVAFVSADRTLFHGFWARSMLLTETPIATRHATESSRGRAAPVLLEDLSTLFASVLHRHSDTPPVLVTSIPQETTVYNLEVEEVHHYIANGFVVHNCNDCPSLAAGSPYTAPGAGGNELIQTPGDGGTDCGAACKCSLQYGSSLMSPSTWAAPPGADDWMQQRSAAIAEALQQRAPATQPDEWERNRQQQIAEATGAMGQRAPATQPTQDAWEIERQRQIAEAQRQRGSFGAHYPPMLPEPPAGVARGDEAVWQRIADALVPGAPISEEEARQQIADAPIDGQLTEGQKQALDLYRKAAVEWDKVRGALPPLDLFHQGEEWQSINFDNLTPEQMDAYAYYIEALREWADSEPLNEGE